MICDLHAQNAFVQKVSWFHKTRRSQKNGRICVSIGECISALRYVQIFRVRHFMVVCEVRVKHGNELQLATNKEENNGVSGFVRLLFGQ